MKYDWNELWVKCECPGMILYIQNALRRCQKIAMDGADVTWGDEAIQEHERQTRRQSVRDTLTLVPKCPLDTSAPSQNVETVRHQCRSVPKTLTLRHRHKKVRHFGTKDIVPNSLRSEVSWVRSVCTPSHHQMHNTWLKVEWDEFFNFFLWSTINNKYVRRGHLECWK